MVVISCAFLDFLVGKSSWFSSFDVFHFSVVSHSPVFVRLLGRGFGSDSCTFLCTARADVRYVVSCFKFPRRFSGIIFFAGFVRIGGRLTSTRWLGFGPGLTAKGRSFWRRFCSPRFGRLRGSLLGSRARRFMRVRGAFRACPCFGGPLPSGHSPPFQTLPASEIATLGVRCVRIY